MAAMVPRQDMEAEQCLEQERGFFFGPVAFSWQRENFLDCSPTYLPSYFIDLSLVTCPFLNQFLVGVGDRGRVEMVCSSGNQAQFWRGG